MDSFILGGPGRSSRADGCCRITRSSRRSAGRRTGSPQVRGGRPEIRYGCVTHLTRRRRPGSIRPGRSRSTPAGQPTGGSSRLADLDTVREPAGVVDTPPGRRSLGRPGLRHLRDDLRHGPERELLPRGYARARASAPSPTAAPSSLASLPSPTGTIFVDRDDTNSGPSGPLPEFDGQPDPGQMYDLGELPQRPTYTVTMTCFDDQTVSWSIGRLYDPGTLTYHDVRSCDGTPRTVDVSLGMPTTPLHLFVIVHDTGGVGKSSQAGRWHIQVSSNDRSRGSPRRRSALAPPRRTPRTPPAPTSSACMSMDRARRARRPIRRRTVPSSRRSRAATTSTSRSPPIGPSSRSRSTPCRPVSSTTIRRRRASVRPSRPARHTPPTCVSRSTASWSPATGRCASGHRDGRRPYDQRLVRRPDPHRGLTAPTSTGASAVGQAGTLWYNPRSVGL